MSGIDEKPERESVYIDKCDNCKFWAKGMNYDGYGGMCLKNYRYRKPWEVCYMYVNKETYPARMYWRRYKGHNNR